MSAGDSARASRNFLHCSARDATLGSAEPKWDQSTWHASLMTGHGWRLSWLSNKLKAPRQEPHSKRPNQKGNVTHSHSLEKHQAQTQTPQCRFLRRETCGPHTMGSGKEIGQSWARAASHLSHCASAHVCNLCIHTITQGVQEWPIMSSPHVCRWFSQSIAQLFALLCKRCNVGKCRAKMGSEHLTCFTDDWAWLKTELVIKQTQSSQTRATLKTPQSKRKCNTLTLFREASSTDSNPHRRSTPTDAESPPNSDLDM